ETRSICRGASTAKASGSRPETWPRASPPTLPSSTTSKSFDSHTSNRPRGSMIRSAANADLHCIESTCGRLAPSWAELNEKADLFLIGGDLTTMGTAAEAAVLAQELSVLEIPVVAVLGNHDYHTGNEGEVRRILKDHGVHVL